MLFFSNLFAYWISHCSKLYALTSIYYFWFTKWVFFTLFQATNSIHMKVLFLRSRSYMVFPYVKNANSAHFLVGLCHITSFIICSGCVFLSSLFWDPDILRFPLVFFGFLHRYIRGSPNITFPFVSQPFHKLLLLRMPCPELHSLLPGWYFFYSFRPGWNEAFHFIFLYPQHLVLIHYYTSHIILALCRTNSH